MKAEEKKQRFLTFAEDIKNLGYKVLLSPASLDRFFYYGYVINDKDEVGSFSLDEWGGGIRFSTMHKPCKNFGCGFSLDDSFEGQTEMTKEIVDRCFQHHPDWAKGNTALIKKYKASEWIKTCWNKEELKEL